MPDRPTSPGRGWLALAHEAKHLATATECWRRYDGTPTPLHLWAKALIGATPGERYCRICRALTHAEAERRCRLPENCPAEQIWPECSHDGGDDPCGHVICRCDCTHCGGEQYVEGDTPGWDDGEIVRCSACAGTGLLRRQTVF